jgi:putative ABC transport system ATP-binding protein
VLNELVEYLKPEKKSLRALITYSALSSLLLLGIPFFIQILINQYSLLVYQSSTLFTLLIIAIFLVGIALMRILQMHLSERLQRRIFVNSVERAKKTFLTCMNEKRQFPRERWNFIFEAVTLQKTLVPLLLDGFIFSIQAILVLIMVAFYHPFFILYSLLIAGGLYVIVVPLGKRTAQLSIVESTAKYEMIRQLQEFSDANSIDSIPSAELDLKLNKYLQHRESRYQSYFRQSVGLMMIKIAAALLLIFIGGLLVVKNQMTIGQLVASELIVTNLLVSLFKFSNILDYLYDSLVCVNKFNTYYQETLKDGGN